MHILLASTLSRYTNTCSHPSLIFSVFINIGFMGHLMSILHENSCNKVNYECFWDPPTVITVRVRRPTRTSNHFDSSKSGVTIPHRFSPEFLTNRD